MTFKPKIFVSSLLGDKLELRKSICNFINQAGAETILYENNLTPSIRKMTYRTDIINADFVIFIVDGNEGTKTKTGLTGVQEEFFISEMEGKPFHIYIKKGDESELISEIKEKNYSYYLYKNERDLLKRIKSSIFIIAKEAALYNLTIKNMPEKKIKKLAMDRDYQLSLRFIKLYFAFLKYYDGKNSGIRAAAFMSVFDFIWEWYLENEFDIFIDSKLTQLFGNFIRIYEEFARRRGADFTFETDKFDTIEIDGIIYDIFKDTPNESAHPINYDWYNEKINEFKEEFEKFRKYLNERKLYFDAMQ